jgi:hypothetical protein
MALVKNAQGLLISPYEKFRQDALKGNTDKSARWYQDKIRQLQLFRKDQDPWKVMREEEIGTQRSQLRYGFMYLYNYDPKTKDKLPYYDTWPLVLPFDTAPGGFVGLNFHYLPPVIRFKLLARLMEYTTRGYTDSERFYVSWSLLKQAAKFPTVRPCVKRYLYNHIDSRTFLKINSDDWKLAVMLPLARFEKETDMTVWKRSMKGIPR